MQELFMQIWHSFTYIHHILKKRTKDQILRIKRGNLKFNINIYFINRGEINCHTSKKSKVKIGKNNAINVINHEKIIICKDAITSLVMIEIISNKKNWRIPDLAKLVNS